MAWHSSRLVTDAVEKYAESFNVGLGRRIHRGFRELVLVSTLLKLWSEGRTRGFIDDGKDIAEGR